MYVIRLVCNSLSIFRFPLSVPWIRYHGCYKDLSINLIYPGKDRDLGGCFIWFLLSFTFTIMWSNHPVPGWLLVAQNGNEIFSEPIKYSTVVILYYQMWSMLTFSNTGMSVSGVLLALSRWIAKFTCSSNTDLCCIIQT